MRCLQHKLFPNRWQCPTCTQHTRPERLASNLPAIKSIYNPYHSISNTESSLSCELCHENHESQDLSAKMLSAFRSRVAAKCCRLRPQMSSNQLIDVLICTLDPGDQEPPGHHLGTTWAPGSPGCHRRHVDLEVASSYWKVCSRPIHVDAKLKP